jgi:GMP synthase (glutamine-hydrolysing)
MKPVLILQNQRDDGPSFLATWLARQGVAVDLRCSEDGDEFPPHLGDHAALALLGGAMSANDDLPTLRHAEALIVEAIGSDRPVIGHCLGGQLIARALGAAVRPSPLPEVGWHALDWLPGASAWFGAPTAGTATVFQWHYEAFELPRGARRLAASPACPNQAFALGPHLALQFHLELDAAKLRRWTDAVDPAYEAARRQYPKQVQSVDAMRADATARLKAQQRLAAAAYRRWLSPLMGSLA